jgi:hypothetical protein
MSHKTPRIVTDVLAEIEGPFAAADAKAKLWKGGGCVPAALDRLNVISLAAPTKDLWEIAKPLLLNFDRTL